MRLLPAIQACCLVASLVVTTIANADVRHYPVPSNEPFEVGTEAFRDRYLTLRDLEGVYIDFNTIRSAGKDLGITIPNTLYEQAQQKIEAADLLFLSEEEMQLTPGQPLMNLWPTYEGATPQSVIDKKTDDENAAFGSCEIPVS